MWGDGVRGHQTRAMFFFGLKLRNGLEGLFGLFRILSQTKFAFHAPFFLLFSYPLFYFNFTGTFLRILRVGFLFGGHVFEIFHV